MARLIPVFKKGSQTSLSNCRPISLLSVLNNLSEKLIYNRIIKSQLIYSLQLNMEFLVLFTKCN